MDKKQKVDVSFVWNIHDRVTHLVFHKNEIGDIMLPFVVIRRMDCILAPDAKKVRATFEQFKDKVNPDKLEPILRKASGGRNFYNVSNFTLAELLNDPTNIDINFAHYLNGFNSEVRNILENFQFDKVIARLVKHNLLFTMISEIAALDLSLEKYDNHTMGSVFEEIIRVSCEESNETAGEHFTPRDMIRLMSAIMFTPEKDNLNRNGIIRTIYDPTCGTGGMVNLGKNFILDELCDEGVKPTILTYGQELNEQSYAIAKSEALITGEDANNIALGNTITEDRFPTKRFNYMMANPPYGMTWKSMASFVANEALNPDGRFYVGTPRTNDGQLLFIQHMLSKMDEGGSRIGVVTNGAPLSTGGAGSGESEIRRWIIENDWLECLIALPTNMFYNTPIATYIWILTNKKSPERKGKIQLINAVSFCKTATKSLGDKRKEIDSELHVPAILKLYLDFENNDFSKIYSNEEFGYRQYTIEQPLRDEKGEIVMKAKRIVADSGKRIVENVPLNTDWSSYFEKEILPHVDSSAWADLSKTKVGYEINFARCFYEFKPIEACEIDIYEDINDKKYESYKKTGIQWIGDIPESWEVLPLKHYTSLSKGTKPEDLSDEKVAEYPYLTMDYLRDRKGKRTLYPTTTEGLSLIDEGEILVLWDGANAGEFILSKKGYIGSTMAHMTVDTEKYDKEYFYFLMKAIEPASKDFSCGTTIPHFDPTVLSDYKYPCPSLFEQRRIASFLKYKSSEIENKIAELEQQISALKGCKQRLVSESVSGKIDLRDWTERKQ